MLENDSAVFMRSTCPRIQSDVLAGWKQVLLRKERLFPSGQVHERWLESGLHADHVQHDPVRGEENPPHVEPRLCWPPLSLFSTNHCDPHLGFHHPHSHLQMRAPDRAGTPTYVAAG